MRQTSGLISLLFGALLGALLYLALFGGDTPSKCDKTYKQWDVLQETILDCMEHPACYITPDTLMQVRTLAPQVAECERKEYAE